MDNEEFLDFAIRAIQILIGFVIIFLLEVIFNKEHNSIENVLYVSILIYMRMK